MHAEAFHGLKTLLDTHLDTSAEYKVLDAGGLDVNSTAQGLDLRPLLPNSTWTVLDIIDQPGVDVVADIRDWSTRRKFDVIVSTEMFEHLENWQAAVPVMAKALSAKGCQAVFITCAGPNRPEHDAYGATVKPDGQYYANITAEDLRAELEKHFKEVVVVENTSPSDLYAFATGVK